MSKGKNKQPENQDEKLADALMYGSLENGGKEKSISDLDLQKEKNNQGPTSSNVYIADDKPLIF